MALYLSHNPLASFVLTGKYSRDHVCYSLPSLRSRDFQPELAGYKKGLEVYSARSKLHCSRGFANCSFRIANSISINIPFWEITKYYARPSNSTSKLLLKLPGANGSQLSGLLAVVDQFYYSDDVARVILTSSKKRTSSLTNISFLELEGKFTYQNQFGADFQPLQVFFFNNIMLTCYKKYDKLKRIKLILPWFINMTSLTL